VQGSLARRLRVLRAERGFTLREAAQEIGIRPATLSQMEQGHTHPRDITLSRVAKAYGVPVVSLIDEAEDVQAPKASAPSLSTPPKETVSGGERRTPGHDDVLMRERESVRALLTAVLNRWSDTVDEFGAALRDITLKDVDLLMDVIMGGLRQLIEAVIDAERGLPPDSAERDEFTLLKSQVATAATRAHGFFLVVCENEEPRVESTDDEQAAARAKSPKERQREIRERTKYIAERAAG
jgi:transcriptional regulator with XRE-family HTH domain